MSVKETIALRDRREPGHLWADNEIFDVFGDALGPNGIVVYMTLARYAYGTTVKMSLRELAGHARIGKDTVARSLKVLVRLGLVVEADGGKVRTVRQFSLANVKKLAIAYLDAKEDVVDHSGVCVVSNCLTVRQTVPVDSSLGLSCGETELSQKGVEFETELSHTDEPCYRQDTRHKTQDTTPIAPKGAEVCGIDRDGLFLRQASARKVLRECGISDDRNRMMREVDAAMALEASKTDEPPDWNDIAERMAAAWQGYRELANLSALKFPVSFRTFVREKWHTPGLWGIDTERLRTRRSAAVGMLR